MKRAVVLVAVALTAGCGSGSNALKVHPDGRIGPLEIDVSTDAQIRDFAGKPDKVERVRWPGLRGHDLIYRCGAKCETTYSINDATGKLSDYWTRSPRFTTERGSHVGMSAAESARLEGKKPHPGCGFPLYIYLRTGSPGANMVFVLAIWKGKIDSIGYLGPHSVYYDGLC